MVEVDLLENRVAALFGGVDHVDHTALQVGQSSDGLHLDCIHLFELVVQDARGVDDLEPETVVVGVADVEGLGGEGVGLHLHVGLADGVDEAGLADVGVASHQDGAFVGVDGGQSAHMFPHFLQVRERGGDLPDHGAHPAQSSSLQGLAPVERICVFDQFEVISAHVFDHILGGLDMPQGEFVVVFIVEHVEQVRVEGVDVLHLREVVEDVEQTLSDRVLAEFDLGVRRGTLRM